MKPISRLDRPVSLAEIKAKTSKQIDAIAADIEQYIKGALQA